MRVRCGRARVQTEGWDAPVALATPVLEVALIGGKHTRTLPGTALGCELTHG